MLEEIPLDQRTSQVIHQLAGHRDESPAVPVNHRSQQLDDHKASNAGILQDRRRRIAQAKASDKHVA